MVPELPSQPGGESAADDRDLQHVVGWTFERQAGVVRGYGRIWSHGSGLDLHDEESERRESEGGVPAGVECYAARAGPLAVGHGAAATPDFGRGADGFGCSGDGDDSSGKLYGVQGSGLSG